MKLSVIVPVYNVKPYLEECIASLTAQSIDDYELILVDDGSTDGSGELVERCGRQYPQLIKTLRVSNGGQGRARNLGMDIAKGDYIGFVDSDDWVKPDMFRRLYDAAESQGADIAVCDLVKCFADGSTRPLPAALQKEPLAAAGSACNKLFRRSLIGDIRFPEDMWYEDFVFSAELLLLSRKTVFVGEELYCYRVGQQSTTNNNNSRKNYDIVSAMERIRRFIEENGIDQDSDFLILNHILLDAISRTAAHHSPDKRATLAKLRGYVRQNIPRLTSCEAYKKESLGRRIAMLLNYYGLEQLTQWLLRLKS